MKQKLLFCGIMLAAAAAPVRSEVKLPAVIGSNMVLQRNTDARLWGTAQPGSTVEITGSWTDQKVTAKADKEGKWATMIPTTEAGGPYTMTFSDGHGSPTELTGVLLGEVWICSGQSNMEMPVGGYMSQPVEGGNQAALDAPLYPDIRMFTVPRRLSADTPAQACDNVWLKPTPLSVRTFSAAGYFFGRELSKMLGVPVGLIAANWGGTPIESWMSPVSLESVANRNKEIADKRKGQEAPVVLYENMILPIAPFSAKGFIWYQGESNRDNWYDYADLQVAMVNDWRQLWQNPEMPFYITAIAPYRYEGDEKRSKAMLVEQQYKAADRLNRSGVAETIDIGERQLIHPAGKEKGSKRLAWMALQDNYGVEGLPQRAPRFKSFENKDGHLYLTFTNLCEENNFNMGDPTQSDSFNCWVSPAGFEVAGADKVFHKAKAKHHWWKNIIEVWSDEVPDPVAVRYGFQNWSGGNVITLAEQPLVPFRSDDWEVTDIW